jgi:hypothetical protein
MRECKASKRNENSMSGTKRVKKLLVVMMVLCGLAKVMLSNAEAYEKLSGTVWESWTSTLSGPQHIGQ